MAKYKYITFVIALLALALMWGCSDRTVDTDPLEIAEGFNSPKNHVFKGELLFQLRNDFQLIQFNVYVPKAAMPTELGGEERPMPYLILLPPEGEDRDFFYNHGIRQLADDLITKGLIEPMTIVMMSNEFRTFGTFFYAGREFAPVPADGLDPGYSYGAGHYDQILGDSLINYLETSYFSWLKQGDPTQRAIGGLGTGAYGAFRVALRKPGLFGSVSGVDGPLDFDGSDGSSGLISLMDSVFVEQPELTSDSLFRANIDSSRVNPITRMFMGGSLAFSPHDTLMRWEERINVNGQLVITIDTTTRGKDGYIITDSSSLIEHIITAGDFDLDFHMPFTYTDRPYLPIWNDFWLPQNLENMYIGTEFNNVDVFIGSSTQARYTFRDQTMSWANTLQDINPTVFELTGYDGYANTEHQYTYDMLRELLIFHSNSFQAE